jgi:hypothetical protein
VRQIPYTIAGDLLLTGRHITARAVVKVRSARRVATHVCLFAGWLRAPVPGLFRDEVVDERNGAHGGLRAHVLLDECVWLTREQLEPRLAADCPIGPDELL